MKLPLFNTFIMEISSLCNRECYFCPNHKYKSMTSRDKNIKLPMSTIRKCIAQLEDLDFRKRIELQLYNEPLLDKRILDITRIIEQRLPHCSVSINTNGSTIKSMEKIEELLDNNIRALEINIYDSFDKYMVFKRWEAEIKKSGKYNFKHASIYQYITKNWRILNVINKTSHNQFKRIHKLQNRAGSIHWLAKPLRVQLKKNCARPFRMFNIDYRGKVILCCNDYFGRVTFGDISKRDIIDIWGNKKFTAFRKRLNEKNRNLPLCKMCDFDGGSYLFQIEKQWRDFL